MHGSREMERQLDKGDGSRDGLLSMGVMIVFKRRKKYTRLGFG